MAAQALPTKAPPLQLIQYARGYCHLCDDMVVALQSLRLQYAFDIEVIDIDAEPNAALLATYDALVPVLCGRNADGALVALCHYFLDLERVRRFFETGV